MWLRNDLLIVYSENVGAYCTYIISTKLLPSYLLHVNKFWAQLVFNIL